jgi:hypothetical protein
MTRTTPVDAAVPASSRLMSPGVAAPAPSDGSPNEIAHAAHFFLRSGTDYNLTQENTAGVSGAEGNVGGGDKASLERGGAMEGSATEGDEEVCHMQHPGS